MGKLVLRVRAAVLGLFGAAMLLTLAATASSVSLAGTEIQTASQAHEPLPFALAVAYDGEQGGSPMDAAVCACRTRCISGFSGCRGRCVSGPNFTRCVRVCTDNQTACFRRCGC